MSEQWPSSGSTESGAEPEDGSSSLNGAEPGEAAAAPEASAEGIVTETDGIATDQPGEPGPESGSEPETVDEGAAFVIELVRAMQTTATAERARTGEDAERRRQGHIDAVRAREAAQADKIRELAADDLKAIEAWADGEMKRIQAERERRSTELNNDLETSLAEHHALIDREIGGIESAIAAYRIEVDSYFDSLSQETDPVLIAQQAARRPVFPNLETAAETAVATGASAASESVAPAGDIAPAEEVHAAASVVAAATESDAAEESAAVASSDGAAIAEPVIDAAPATDEVAEEPQEPAVIAVMAPSAQVEPGESWTVPAESTPESPEPAEPVAVEAVEAVGAASSPSQSGTGSLINSVPVHRPMSWLRRDSNEGDRSNPGG